jgi:hypothetical protein
VQTLKKQLGVIAAVMAVIGSAGAAPALVYENRGEADTPQIDAITFLNRGFFTFDSGLQPYDTQNTLYFTNFAGATIAGSGGMRFSYTDESGLRRPASSFSNSGFIDMQDSFGSFGSLPNAVGFLFFDSSWLLIDATNVSSRGTMQVGSQGLMKIRGGNVNVSRTGLRAGEDPNQQVSDGFDFGDGTYLNGTGVTEQYWAVGLNNRLDTENAGPNLNLNGLTGPAGFSGTHEVLVPSGFTNRLSVFGANSFIRTNALSPTNWLVQMVFVSTNSTDPLLKTDVRFGEPRNPSVDGALMSMVQFTFEDVDTLTGNPYTNYVYVLDSLGAQTNAVYFTNAFNTNYARPSSLLITRVTPPEWDAAQTTNNVLTPELVIPVGAADSVTNLYTAYAAQIGSVTTTGSRPGGGFGGFFRQNPALSHPTNLPGRIEIEAANLDLTLTRIRSDGLLSLKSQNMQGRAPFKLDSPVVSVDVASTNGFLAVTNLVQPTVRRFSGQVGAWSAIWTNTIPLVDEGGGGGDPGDPATPTDPGFIEIRYHALIVNRAFDTIRTVETYQFRAAADELLIQDELTVVERLVLDTPTLTLAAPLNVDEISINTAMFPRLVTLTNRSTVVTFSDINLGRDGPVNTNNNLRANTIKTMVNEPEAEWYGTTITLGVDELSNAGLISAYVGDLEFITRDLKFDGGEVYSAANLWITALDFKAENSVLSAGYSSGLNINPGALILDVTSRLTDGGVDAANDWMVHDGFQMVRKPLEGDLLGTTITSMAARFAEVVHTWAGEDRGATVAGYENNAALGQLILDGRLLSLFTFRPPGATPTALYVDRLELLGDAVDVVNTLNLEGGFKIYFADSNVPAEELDGLLDGGLVWVADRAGDLSGEDVVMPDGAIVRVNRSLLNSTRIDSDGDGIPNAQDASPFSASALKIAVRILAGTPAQAEISWVGAPNGKYRVEVSKDVTGGPWEELTTCEHRDAVPGVVKVSDDLGSVDQPRFYRVMEIR